MKNKALPGQSEQPEESVCAHCGRYVGPVTKCGFCGAPVRSRLSLRIFRWAAVLLATVGLALLYYMSTMQEVPVVEIGSIKNTMNFAYIHVEGSVPAAPRVYREGDNVSSVSFMIDDGTGSIPVKAYGKNAQKLIATRKLPRAGDRIAIDGSLNVSADRKVLYLQVPEKVEILDRHEIPAVRIGDLNAGMQGGVVTVAGRLGRPITIKSGVLYYLNDDSGRIKVVLWDSQVIKGGSREELRKGVDVRVTGEVNIYRDELEIVPRDEHDIVLVDQPAEE